MSSAPNDGPADGFVRHTVQEMDLEDSGGVVEEVRTEPFRPRRRAPMAVLTVHADGGEHESTVPVFRSPFVIGRAEGDFLVEHDLAMSKRHVALTRRPTKSGETWFLEDLNSRNGLYVRAVRAMLGHGEELLLGSRRFRVVDEQGTANRGTIADADDLTGDASDTASDTLVVEAKRREPRVDLVEVVDSKPQGQRLRLEQSNQWLGRNERLCSLVLDDPMISPRHALLRPAKDGKWTIADARSVNGVWVRVKGIPLADDQPCQFQVGEQRFTVRVP